MADLKISALTSATTPLAGTEVLPLVQSSTTKKVAVSDLTAGRTVTLGQGIISRNMSSGNWLVLDDSRGGFGDWAFYKAGSNDLTFGYDTTGGSAPVSAITFEYGGDVKIQTGNFVVGTSGKGIDFSATSGSGTSELLSDYEEGTWTPVIADATSGGNVATVGTTVARYTKIGRTVFVQASLDNIDTTGMTAGNAISIRGLPYANASGVVAIGSCSMNRISYTYNSWRPQIDGGNSLIQFTEYQSGNFNYNTMLVSNIVSSGTSDIYLNITYTV
jgi:hypothetical protein